MYTFFTAAAKLALGRIVSRSDEIKIKRRESDEKKVHTEQERASNGRRPVKGVVPLEISV